MVKNLPANAGDVRDMGLNPESGRSPEGGHGNLLRYSCQRIPKTEEPGRLQSVGWQTVSLIHTHTHTHTHTHIYISRDVL